MNFRFFTRNSTYEVDPERKLIRRVEGRNPPTKWFTPEGEWKPYREIVGIEADAQHPAFVAWDDRRATWLSPVVAIQESFT